jgi:hypothetical protein
MKMFYNTGFLKFVMDVPFNKVSCLWPAIFADDVMEHNDSYLK